MRKIKQQNTGKDRHYFEPVIRNAYFNDFTQTENTSTEVEACALLEQAARDIEARGKCRDQLQQSNQEQQDQNQNSKQGERSMKKTVAAFNALTNQHLSELDGWLFMICLKLARAQGGAFHLDDYQDGAAYCALAGEAAAKLEQLKQSTASKQSLN